MTMKRTPQIVTLAAVVMTSGLSVRPLAQSANPPGNSEFTLVIGGDIAQALSVTPAELKAMPPHDGDRQRGGTRG